MDLLRKVKDNMPILQIRESKDDHYHLIMLMIKDYLVGFDFKRKEFLFEKKLNWFTQDRVFKLVIIVNIFLFVVSVFIGIN